MKFMEFVCALSRKMLRNVRMKVYYKCALYHYSQNISICLTILSSRVFNQVFTKAVHSKSPLNIIS